MNHAAPLSDPAPGDLPVGYVRTIRILLRFAIVLAVISLLIGISYQESTKKLPFEKAEAGLHVEAVLPLALVHGHTFVLGVLLPIALAGMLLLARRVGGREVGPWALRGATGILLPFIALSLALQLYKGYHFLLGVRRGETDFAVIDHGFLGGVEVLRYGIYALAHGGLALGLGLFLWGIWRSLSTRPA